MHNTRNTIVTAFFLAFAFFSAAVSAAPQNGFGVYVGVVGADENGVQSTGVSLGADAQFVGSDRWSFNPYLMLSAEKNDNDKKVMDGIAGIQARRWIGEWFLGAQLLVHDRLIIGDSVESSSYGPGTGLVAGFELPSGWGAEIQADLLETLNFGGERNAVRMHISYRWH